MSWRAPARRALVGAALLAAACGGSGGGGGGGTAPPQPGLTFTPAGTAGSNSIFLNRSNGADPNLLELEVRARQVPDLYGVAFDLEYPAALRFDTATEGTFLNAGAMTSFQVSSAQAGRVVVGLTRLGPVAGLSGEGVLLTLRFTATGAGSGELRFSNRSAFNSNRTPLGAVEWLGGSVTVTR